MAVAVLGTCVLDILWSCVLGVLRGLKTVRPRRTQGMLQVYLRIRGIMGAVVRGMLRSIGDRGVFKG